MEIICKNNPAHHFEVTDEDMAFYAKMDVPPPTLCPPCRMQRRLVWRNERKLYNGKCAKCGGEMVSVFSPEKPYTVYCHKCWWADDWDPYSYGRDIDFTRPFFEQFDELLHSVPLVGLINGQTENAVYTNYSERDRNCYLLFATNRNEDCYYGEYIWDSKDCVDCTNIQRCQLCHMCVDCNGCYDCRRCQKCFDCSNLELCYDMRACQDCFGCSGLRRKSFHILNRSVSPEEYRAILSDPNKRQIVAQRFALLKAQTPRLYAEIDTCDGCTGSYLANSSNALECYNSFGLKDARFTENSPGGGRDVYDVSGCTDTELGYEIVSIAKGYNLRFCLTSYSGLHDATYCLGCHSGHDFFGCIGVSRGEYCILNKSYTREEYTGILARLIDHMRSTGEWGEFFPMSLAPFGYNETVAFEHFPLPAEEAQRLGAKWKEEGLTSVHHGAPVALPEDIRSVPDDVVRQILTCEGCSRAYKILPQELRFYRERNIAVPKICFNCRYAVRISQRNPMNLYDRRCMKCSAPIRTTYAPDRKEMVYCEKCYQESVY